MDKDNFINTIKDKAVIYYSKYNLFASMTIAQAICESGWGRSGLTQKGNNLFGIKAGTSWKGPYLVMKTSEYVGGKYVSIDAKFRKYNSYSESLEDHCKLLLSDRYKDVRKAANYSAACAALESCGYATSPTYSETLIKIIQDNHLDTYDTKNIILVPDIHVKRFQMLCNLLEIEDDHGNKIEEDNKCGPITKSCIKKMRKLENGCRGEDVRYIQRYIKTDMDGIFGPITKAAVRIYQRKHLLEIDGICGQETWTCIVENGY